MSTRNWYGSGANYIFLSSFVWRLYSHGKTISAQSLQHHRTRSVAHVNHRHQIRTCCGAYIRWCCVLSCPLVRAWSIAGRAAPANTQFRVAWNAFLSIVIIIDYTHITWHTTRMFPSFAFGCHGAPQFRSLSWLWRNRTQHIFIYFNTYSYIHLYLAHFAPSCLEEISAV